MTEKETQKKKMYMVMKLNKEITYTDAITGKEVSIKLGGVAGFVPVFSNLKDAKKSSQKGKYDIIAIQA